MPSFLHFKKPKVSLEDDSWLLIHSDGLNNTEIRGGGGGLTNEQVATFCSKSGHKEMFLYDLMGIVF